jgi:hypothetical protein
LRYTDTRAATEAAAQRAAERAVTNPAKLAKAARVFRVALTRGLVTPDGEVIEQPETAS